ncbi:Flp family type IVb pilin [Rhizobium sp. CFBP 8762]|uniref:Flp family type IVb pilin n=1 Tax=Rhizobium sp. CFBP 8762 TaxID=2775279 RepID=UPI00177AEE6B|nr:Flp family type IVb pilin [Rhizobium sp. CFBP 8762]MBD8555343.1 Flp family type IVb pilin [Rhizobium sp. CFBP 8762]
MKHAVTKFLSDESGATAVEYALIVGLVGAAVLALGDTFKKALVDLYGELAAFLESIEFDKTNGVK